MKTKQFHVGDVLTITTGGILLSPRGMSGVYDILRFLTGVSVAIHQIPRAIGACKHEMLKQHPQLADVDASAVNRNNGQSWLNEQVAKFGEKLVVRPLPAGIYETRDPVQELEEMAPNKVITFIMD